MFFFSKSALLWVLLVGGVATAQLRTVTFYSASADGLWCIFYGSSDGMSVRNSSLETMPYVAGPFYLGEAATDVVPLPGDRLQLVVAAVRDESAGCASRDEADYGDTFENAAYIPLGNETILGWDGDFLIRAADGLNTVLVNADRNESCTFCFLDDTPCYRLSPLQWFSTDRGCRDGDQLSVVCGDLEANATYDGICEDSERHHVAALAEGVLVAPTAPGDCLDSCPRLAAGGSKKKKSSNGLDASEVVAVAVLVPVGALLLLFAAVFTLRSGESSAKEATPAGEVELEEAKKSAGSS